MTKRQYKKLIKNYFLCFGNPRKKYPDEVTPIELPKKQGATVYTQVYVDNLKKRIAELETELEAINKAGEHVRQEPDKAFSNKPSYAEDTCPDVFCEDCTKECEVKKIGLISEVEK